MAAEPSPAGLPAPPGVSAPAGAGSLAAVPNAFSRVAFSAVCELFEAIRAVDDRGKRGYAKRRRILDAFFETHVPGFFDGERVGAFDLYRLILPNVDKERSVYKLKEQALAVVIGNALGLKRGASKDFLALEGWRKRGSGNFAQTVFEVAKTHRPVSGVSRASVGDVNAALDALAAARSKAEQIPVMARLVEATDATQLKWLAAIIIKDLKLGYGETAILRHFHPDANDLYNVCCDLRRVCDNLRSRARRFKRRDLEPGSLVKAMMASRVHSCAAAFDAMRNKRFVIESKFDGERIQVHREGPDAFRYFTRNNNDFGPRGYDVLDRLFKARLRAPRCVLDGELVIWNKRDRTYAEFGYLRSFVKAIVEGRGAKEFCAPDGKQPSARPNARGGGGGSPDAEGEGEGGGGGGGGGGGASEAAFASEAALASDGAQNSGEAGFPPGGSSTVVRRFEGDAPLLVGDLELVYVAFDALYDTDHSVIDRPLSERHEILRAMFLPLARRDGAGGSSGFGGAAEVSGSPDGSSSGAPPGAAPPASVDPDGGVRLARPGRVPGAVRGRVVLCVPELDEDAAANPDCVVGTTARDVEDQLWRRIERQEEGLVLKDLDSRWTPGERDKAWVKLKPDYLPTEDIDVVVMGGFYGTGRLRGGKIAEYLIGACESGAPGAPPLRAVSFSKVGTGMSAEVMSRLRRRLEPHMRPAGKGHRPPSCYVVTNSSTVRPDVWIDHPDHSVVFTVKADIRLVRTKAFAAPFSLRFPRVVAVRWDKPWTECLSVAELERKAATDGGIAVDLERADGTSDRHGGTDHEGPSGARKRRRGEKEKGGHNQNRAAADASRLRDARLPAHLAPADTRHVARADSALADLDVWIIGASKADERTEGAAPGGAAAAEAANAAKAALAALVAARGGSHSEAFHPGVTHVVAPPEARRRAQFTSVVRRGGVDVLTPEWLRECVDEGRVVTPRPRHRLHLSRATVERAEGRVDDFGDEHAVDVASEDAAALLDSERTRSAMMHAPATVVNDAALEDAAAQLRNAERERKRKRERERERERERGGGGAERPEETPSVSRGASSSSSSTKRTKRTKRTKTRERPAPTWITAATATTRTRSISRRATSRPPRARRRTSPRGRRGRTRTASRARRRSRSGRGARRSPRGGPPRSRTSSPSPSRGRTRRWRRRRRRRRKGSWGPRGARGFPRRRAR